MLQNLAELGQVWMVMVNMDVDPRVPKDAAEVEENVALVHAWLRLGMTVFVQTSGFPEYVVVSGTGTWMDWEDTLCVMVPFDVIPELERGIPMANITRAIVYSSAAARAYHERFGM